MMADEKNDAGVEGTVSNEDVAPEAVELSDVEQLAVEMGWKPEAEYTGDKAKWKPARDFILAEREISRRMKDDVRHLRDQVNRMASASTKQTERALRQQAQEFNRKFNEAVENKDAAAAAEAARGLRELEETARAESNATEQDFASNNPWYGTNDEATAYAIAISQREAAKGKSHAEQLSIVEQSVRKRFPELFGEQVVPARQPAEVHTPSRSVTRSKAKGFADLPVAVKDAAERYAKLFKDKHNIDPEKTKADYARDYWAGQEAA